MKLNIAEFGDIGAGGRCASAEEVGANDGEEDQKKEDWQVACVQEGEGIGAVLAADFNGVDVSVCIEVKEVGGSGGETESYRKG
jgi:hypothetical protein